MAIFSHSSESLNTPADVLSLSSKSEKRTATCRDLISGGRRQRALHPIPQERTRRSLHCGVPTPIQDAGADLILVMPSHLQTPFLLARALLDPYVRLDGRGYLYWETGRHLDICVDMIDMNASCPRLIEFLKLAPIVVLPTQSWMQNPISCQSSRLLSKRGSVLDDAVLQLLQTAFTPVSR